jgi:hypothetical protein
MRARGKTGILCVPARVVALPGESLRGESPKREHAIVQVFHDLRIWILRFFDQQSKRFMAIPSLQIE